MIRLKGHSVVAFELPARCRWINRQCGQLLVRKPSSRSALDFGTEALNQFRRTFTWLHRIATQTRTISALQRFARTREEIDVLSRRLFRRAISLALFSMNEDRSTLGIWMTGRNCRVRK